MPYDVLIYAAYKYNKSQKRKAKQAAKKAENARQQAFLDLLDSSNTTNLSESDAEVLTSNEKIEYGSDKDAYLGPPFGTSDDYIEILIHDTQNNLLETGVVDNTDYIYDEEEGGIRIKTGTILRKMGYDRGRFNVLYNFLRKMAGSPQTLVTDVDGQVYNGEVNENEIGNSLFIKEDKYNVHEISDSRTELRLITQNIRDEDYLRRFYKLGSKQTKYQADETPISNIEFVGTAEEKETSKQIRFIPVTGMNEGRFMESMKGGMLTIPNFFVTRKIETPIATSGQDLGYEDYEIFGGDEQRASFRIVELIVGAPKQNNGNQYGDRYLGIQHRYFEGFRKDDVITNPVTGEQSTGTKEDAKALRDIGITTDKYLDEYTDPDYKVKSDYGLQGRIENIVALEEPIFNTVIFNRSEGVATVDLESNSTFFTDSSVTYTWEFFGWDVDRNRNMFNTTTSFNLNILKRKYKPNGGDNNGDISIDSVPDNNLYATEDSSGNGLKASITLNPADRNVDTFPPNARPGARVRVSCHSGGCKVGCQLTVKDNATQRTEVTAIPNIFRTS
jgi:hypothetical protein